MTFITQLSKCHSIIGLFRYVFVDRQSIINRPTPFKNKQNKETQKKIYPRRCPRALLTVALPRAKPTPRPRCPRERNMGAFLEKEKKESVFDVYRHTSWCRSESVGEVYTSAYPAQ
jgi:hypothetical protein